MAAQAISFITRDGNVKIKNIKVINWGSTSKDAESFVVSVFNVGSTGRIARKIVFDGVEVTQPAPVENKGSSTLIGAHGQDVVNPKTISNGWIDGVEIKNCYVHDFDFDVPTGTGVVGMGSNCHSVRIHHNRFENLGPKNYAICGCYLDTGASDDVVIEDNILSAIPHGVFASLGTHDPVTKWVIRNNHILINREHPSGGIELRGTQTTLRNIVVEKNTIGSATGKPLSTAGIALGRVNGATVRDNTIDDIGVSNHIALEPGVTNCRLSNNRRRNGAIIQGKSRGSH